MKQVLTMLLLIVSIVSCAQKSPTESLHEIKRIIENYETCNGFFCFVSEASYDSPSSMLVVKSIRYNIDDEGNEKLTETRFVKIPMKKGTVANVFPDEDDTIIITTEDNEIHQSINEEEEMVDYTILVFNNQFVTEKLSKVFLKNFKKVVKANR